jgi:small subunit ribosomal protein S11
MADEKETKPVTRKKKERKNVPFAIAKIQATFNNTIITITEPNGNVVCWASSGASGFKGSKKSTPFAAQVAGDTVARRAMDQGVRALDVEIRGPGAGREAAVRALQSAGIKVHTIRDTTPIPHNGCRPPKRRRV